ncbi:MAG: hypothetical protein D6813_13190, partial [Calditrichaeota bacterium]
GILIAEFSNLFELEILISSIVAGIVVENLSNKGEELLQGIKTFSLPLYIVFFVLAGASLHLQTLQKSLLITLVLVVMRLFFLFISNYLAGKWLKKDRVVTNLSWMGFVGQAGIAIGLTHIIEKAIPGENGKILVSILLATVVINEFMGPIFFKILIEKAKEGQSIAFKKNKF